MILDLQRDSTCVFDGEKRMKCERCARHEVPGCDARVQDGRLFFWSDSNVQYESVDDDMRDVPKALETWLMLKRKIIL